MNAFLPKEKYSKAFYVMGLGQKQLQLHKNAQNNVWGGRHLIQDCIIQQMQNQTTYLFMT